jgi:hypothetical protein
MNAAVSTTSLVNLFDGGSGSVAEEEESVINEEEMNDTN